MVKAPAVAVAAALAQEDLREGMRPHSATHSFLRQNRRAIPAQVTGASPAEPATAAAVVTLLLRKRPNALPLTLFFFSFSFPFVPLQIFPLPAAVIGPTA